ncbi:hypothetical protein J7L87_05535 [bacterium]|nr:hypothetical protein [bacterium]
MKKFGLISILLILFSVKLSFSQSYQYPFAIVPYVGGSSPQIDGTVGEKEYKNFLAITGMVTWGGPSGELKSVVPSIQQVIWFLGYDDKYFYIAMKSPNPPESWPLARVKKYDESFKILWDDHVEIQIAKDREKATFPGIGFYKIMANAKGYYSDEWYMNGTPGTESEWSIGGKVKCSVNEKFWDMEIAIDIRAFEEESLDGEKWVLQLLRADEPGGIYFAGWVGEAWMSWKKFGEVLFDRKAPVFRFLDTGKLARGNMDLKFEITGQTEKETPVFTSVSVYNSEGKKIFEKEERTVAVKGKTEKLEFTSKLSLSEKGKNRIKIYSYYTDGKGKNHLLYRFEAPIIYHTESYWAKHIKPWLERKPKADYEWNFAYWPSYNVAEVKVDFDFFGLDKKYEKAKYFEVYVKGKRRIYGKSKEMIKNKQGYTIFKNLNLPTGEYKAEIRIFDEKNRLLDKKSISFVRKKYKWENNKLGISDKVWPPYKPIKVLGEREFEVWNRKYVFGVNGLFEKIFAGGGDGMENILSGKMDFYMEISGRKAKAEKPLLKIKEVKPGKVKFEGKGRFGDLKYEIESFLEYDGWYDFTITLIPEKEKVEVDEFYLSIPLWNKVDTMYIQRAGDGRRGNKFGSLPEGKGLIWSSQQLLPFEDWGSFVPIVFLGNGDKGLWWFAEEKRDWELSDKKGCIEIYRRDKNIELRINIFGKKAEVKSPRKIHFAFLVDPVKQIPDERKWAWGRLKYGHSTYGYRYYGGSVDGFENTDKDLEALRKVFIDPEWKPEKKPENKSSLIHMYHFRNHAYNSVGLKNQMFVLYGSTSLTGLGLDAFDTYGGEWLGKTNWETHPQTEFKGWVNSQGTKEWKTDRELTTVGVNFTRSFEDCFVWYHYKLLSKVPVNGTWWDNRSITVIKDYDPERGEFYKRFNVFTRRRLTKRLFNIGYELGRRPWWINNMHVDWSFCQVSWHVENDFYIDNADMTMMEQLPVDQFRALCRIKRGIIHRLASRSPAGNNEQIRKQGRSIIGMCLLHDIGSYFWGPDRYFADAILNLLEEKVGFFEGAEFIPYWRNEKYLKIKTEGVYASIYRGRGKAVIVVVNEDRKSKNVEFEISDSILKGKIISKIYDGETGISFGKYYDRKERKRKWGEFGKPGIFGIGGCEVRFLVVE